MLFCLNTSQETAFVMCMELWYFRDSSFSVMGISAAWAMLCREVAWGSHPNLCRGGCDMQPAPTAAFARPDKGSISAALPSMAFREDWQCWAFWGESCLSRQWCTGWRYWVLAGAWAPSPVTPITLTQFSGSGDVETTLCQLCIPLVSKEELRASQTVRRSDPCGEDWTLCHWRRCLNCFCNLASGCLNKEEESSRAHADLPSYLTSKYTKNDQLSKLLALALVSTYVFIIHVFTYNGKCGFCILHLMMCCLG